MANETEDDFIRMQQEAIRRVREMQSRARATLENAGMHIESGGEPVTAAPRADSPRAEIPYVDAPVYDTPQQQAPAETPHENVQAPHVQAPHAQPQRAEAQNARSTRQSDSAQAQSKKQPERPAPHRDESPLQQIIPSFLQKSGLNINLESDQILLMLALYLLIQDGADKWLILALGYVLIT